jgi:hypothetical protein
VLHLVNEAPRLFRLRGRLPPWHQEFGKVDLEVSTVCGCWFADLNVTSPSETSKTLAMPRNAPIASREILRPLVLAQLHQNALERGGEIVDQPLSFRRFHVHHDVTDVLGNFADAIQEYGFADASQAEQHLTFFRAPDADAP